METIGYQLRAARSRKNCTLEDAAKATKIKVEQLMSLEADDFGKLTAPIYARAFLKTYAQFLELDSCSISEQFSQQLGEIEYQLPLVQPSPGSAAASPEPFQLTPQLLVGVVIILVTLVGVISWGWLHPKKPVSSLPPTSVVGTAPQPSREFYLKGPILDETIAVPTSRKIPSNHALIVKGRKSCYIQVTADGIQVFQGILRSGQQRTFTAKQFHLIVDNPGAMAVWLDAKELPKLGREGERIERDLPAPNK